jgi:drug/metabolite transporter (DMT)-like permease
MIPLWGKELSDSPENKKLLFMRSVVGSLGFGFYVFGIPLLPLGIVTMVANTKPFWATIISFLFIGETLGKFEICAMLCSFAGILLVSFSKQIEGTPEDEVKVGSKYDRIIGAFCILGMAVFAASVGVLTRKM